MSLEGTEVAVKLAGKGAKEIALLLYAVLKDQKKTSGKTRLTNMLRSGKELKVFAVQDKDLARFCKEAKKYGVLYCVLKDRDANDGITDTKQITIGFVALVVGNMLCMLPEEVSQWIPFGASSVARFYEIDSSAAAIALRIGYALIFTVPLAAWTVCVGRHKQFD